MSRPVRIALIILGSLAGLVLVLVAAALLIARTAWFHDFVREKIIAQVEGATGGRAEVASFAFDWRQLRAEATDFVLHGTEPPNSEPLFRARSIVVGLRIISVLKHDVDIALLEIHEPRVLVMVKPDGTTNLPEPKVKKKRDKKPLETVVDLAIGRFQIDNGLLEVASRKTPFDARGENLRAQFLYEMMGLRYRGELSMEPLYVDWGKGKSLPVTTRIPLVVEKNRIESSGAELRTPQSKLELTVSLDDVTTPRGSLRLAGDVSLAEVAPDMKVDRSVALKTDLALNGRRLDISRVEAKLGESRVDASGTIQDTSTQRGFLRFSGIAAVGELARIWRAQGRPDGTVRLEGDATLRGAGNYLVAARATGRDLAFEQGGRRIQGIQTALNLEARPDLLQVSRLRVDALGGTFTGQGSLIRMERYRLDGDLSRFELRQLARQYSNQPIVWDGIVSGPLHAEGDLKSKSVRAGVRLGITPGTQGVPLTGRLNVDCDSRRDVIDLGSSYLATPATRIDMTGSVGNQLRVKLTTRDFNDLLPAMALASSNTPKSLPVSLRNGVANVDATVSGKLSNPTVAGQVAATNLTYQQQTFDRLTTGVQATKSGAAVQNLVLTQGRSQVRLDASVSLREWRLDERGALSATAAARQADIARLAALAGPKPSPVTGTLDASAKVTGTVEDPQGILDATVAKGTAYDEPFDRAQAHVTYTGRRIELSSAQVTAKNARIDASGAFDHPPKDFQSGRVIFHLATNTIAINQLQTVVKKRPGISGTLQLNADGAGNLRQASAGQPRFLLADLNANLQARSLELDQKRLGDLTATAQTQGQEVAFRLQSDFADSDIRGNGTWRLAGDYPVNAQVTFTPLQLSHVRQWLARQETAQPSDFEGWIEGRVDVAGPALHPENLKGALRLTRLEFGSMPKSGPGIKSKQVWVKNRGPVVVSLDRSTVRVENAHLAGDSTDLTVAGDVNLKNDNTANLRVKGGIGLDLVQAFEPDVFASGSIAVDAAVQGKLAQPNIDGKAELRNASLNMEDLPNGISNANGQILFNRTQAVIENMTAESGGGKLTLTGMAMYGSREMTFRLEAKAQEVRVRYPEGVSTLANADITVSGSTARSLLSGTVTILQTGFHPRTDFGSVLAKAAQPERPETARTGLLGGMQFDIHIESSPDIRFQTALAQDIQADANLRLRGTPSRPAVLGRVDITQGELIFLGTKYTIDQGRVSFFNPQKIEPELNIDLETQAKGITVILSVTGPIDRLQISYRSDPPLQFSEIVQLLATGKMPTSDPALLAQQPAAPSQSWEQMGASFLGQAIASPVSGRLQRLFGVTKLKIDPQLAGVENNPQARVTLEQQITRDLTFTYIQNVTQTNSLAVRIEWAFSPEWSAVAVRDENGRIGLDFLLKKRLR